MKIAVVVVALVLAIAAYVHPATAQRGPIPTPPAGEVLADQLPSEARATLALIRKGGPYPYAKDHSIFGNREARLPRKKRGYYREYTVKTPGERTRGARRIIKGQGGELYYTNDHYSHFRTIKE